MLLIFYLMIEEVFFEVIGTVRIFFFCCDSLFMAVFFQIGRWQYWFYTTEIRSISADTKTSRGKKSFGILHNFSMFVLIVDKFADWMILSDSIVSIIFCDNSILMKRLSIFRIKVHLAKSRSTYNLLITLFWLW